MPNKYNPAQKTLKSSRKPSRRALSWRSRLFNKRSALPIVVVAAFALLGGFYMLKESRAYTAPTGTITGIAGKCIDVRDNNRFNGQTAWLWTCHGGPAQQWTMNGDGTISNQGFCLDVKGGIFAERTPVWIWQCVGNNAQKWERQSNGTLRNPASGLCLDDMWGATNDGNPLWLWGCNGGAAQVWYPPVASNWQADPGAPTGIITGIANKCIDLRNAQRLNGNTVWLWTCHGGEAQQWSINKDGTISNQGYCLDVKGGILQARTQIGIWQCVGNNAQIWKKQPNGTLMNPASNLCLDDMWGATNDGNPLWLWPCVGGAAQTWRTSTGPAINWGETRNAPPGGWHRLAKLNDGSWLQVTTAGVNGSRSDLTIHRSTDNGRNWYYMSTVSTGRLLDNGNLYQAPDGSIVLSGRNNIPGSAYAISQWRSTNGGAGWARQTDVDAAGAGPRGVWEPTYFTAAGNQTVVQWADETHPGYSQVIVQRVSNNSGNSWGPETVIVADGANGRPGMPVTARMANGQYMMVYEICGTRGCGVFQKISGDGVNWPGGIGYAIPGVTCGPGIVGLSDGRVVVTGCRTSDGDYTTPIVYTEDYGATWRSNPSAIGNGGQYGYWPALYQTGPNEIVSVNGALRFGSLSPR